MERYEYREWGLALGWKAQTSMLDIVMSFIPMYKVIGSFLFFMSLLLMMKGGFQLFVMVVTIYCRCEVWDSWFSGGHCSSCGLPLQLVDKVMEDVWDKVGRMLSTEASHHWKVEGCADQTEKKDTIEELTKKYP